MPLTLAILLTPLLGALTVLALPGGRPALVKGVSLAWTLVALALALVLSWRFAWWDEGVQMASSLPWVSSLGLSFGLGVDGVSLWLLLLTVFLMPLVMLGSMNAGGVVDRRVKEYCFWLLTLEAAMAGVFVATDAAFFYICFEFTLIPMYFLIGVYGSTQRLRAARVFFLYTFTGSMLTFAGLLYAAWLNASAPAQAWAGAGSWTFDIATLHRAAAATSPADQAWLLGALLAGFAVKVPLFPFHTWLPLAHTEAPTAGSVVLAGVLLKLGTYAILRLALPLAPHAAIEWAPFIGALATTGVLWAALICWVQKDIKKLIAYSSVSHLGFCVLGLFALSSQQSLGASGAVAYMVNHGLSTGALFLCVGMLYERFHTREMARFGGLAKVMPLWSSFMVFFCLASVGLPGLNGFVGEFLTLLGAFLATGVLGPGYAAVAGVGMILGAVYLLHLLGRVVWGPTRVPAAHHGSDDHSSGHPAGHSAEHPAVQDLNAREVAVLLPLAAACLLLGLFPAAMLKSIDGPVRRLTAPAAAVLAGREAPPSPTGSLGGPLGAPLASRDGKDGPAR